jgi:transcriptional regulator with XRE-family HTH domain
MPVGRAVEITPDVIVAAWAAFSPAGSDCPGRGQAAMALVTGSGPGRVESASREATIERFRVDGRSDPLVPVSQQCGVAQDHRSTTSISHRSMLRFKQLESAASTKSMKREGLGFVFELPAKLEVADIADHAREFSVRDQTCDMRSSITIVHLREEKFLLWVTNRGESGGAMRHRSQIRPPSLRCRRAARVVRALHVVVSHLSPRVFGFRRYRAVTEVVGFPRICAKARKLTDKVDNLRYTLPSGSPRPGDPRNECREKTMSSVALARELSVNAVILRARVGLSQAALCERAGISRDTLSRIERGEADPTLSVLGKLASALGVEVVELFSSEHMVDVEDTDDDELLLRAARGREGNVKARALLAAIDEAAGFSPERYSQAGRPRMAS